MANTFTDYLEKELEHLDKLSEDNESVSQVYERKMLQTLMGNYDDINDFINIQKALTRMMELVTENVEQCTLFKHDQ